MTNKYLALFLCFGFVGCASNEGAGLAQKYLEIYGKGLNSGEVTSIVKAQSYQELENRLESYFNMLGFTKAIVVDPKQGFIVFVKPGSAYPSSIIFKYTAIQGKYKTSFDFVKGSNNLNTDREVKEDIHVIAELLKE